MLAGLTLRPLCNSRCRDPPSRIKGLRAQYNRFDRARWVWLGNEWGCEERSVSRIAACRAVTTEIFPAWRRSEIRGAPRLSDIAGNGSGHGPTSAAEPVAPPHRGALSAGLAFRRACLREVDGVARNKRCRADSRYLDDVVRRHKCRFVRDDLLGRVAVPSKNDEAPPLAVS